MIKTEILNLITKKTLGLTFVLTAATIAFAQEKQQITGKIIDTNNAAVPYASVSFVNKSVKENATLYSDATLTDEKGNYTVNLISGNYEITVEAIDFKKLIITKQIGKSANIGNIKIESEGSMTNTKTKEIQGVTLTAKSSAPYKIELDKKVYNVDQDLTAKGGNLQDVLQNVPSVNVDSDGSVSMRGNTNVRFLINGKPSSILGITDDTNALRNIPADQIEKIEVITNPSSKFEASGTAGILNIILKKSKGIGFNGSVEGSIGYLPQSRLNTNLSWNYGKLTWFVNGGGGFGRMENTNSIYTNKFSNNSISSSKTTNKNDFKNYNFNTGVNYNFTNKTSANFSVTLNQNTNESNNLTSDYSSLYNANTRRISLGEGINNTLQFDAGIEHKLDEKGQLISASASYQDSKNNSSENIDDNSPFATKQFQNLVNNNKQKTWIAKLDYELPLGKNSKIEAGARYDDRNNFTDNIRTDDYLINPAINTFFTNNTDYTEKISAFYAQFKSKIEKFAYQLGLRNENTSIKTIYNGVDPISNISYVNQLTEKNYNGFFPSVFLSYNITENSQFSLNYSKRINRPRSFQLIPAIKQQNAGNYFRGNANLNPSYVNSFEFGYNYSKGGKLTLNPTFYYQRTTDDVNFTVTLDSQNNFISSPANIGTEDKYGMDFNYNFSANKWLRLFGNINIYGYKNQSSYNNITTTKDGFSTQSRLTASMKLDKTTSMQLSGMFRGREKSYLNDRLEMYVANFGISKNIWNNQGTINFNVQDIFNTRRRRVNTTSTDYYREADMQMMPRTFMLSLSYRFKNKEAKEVKQKPKKQDQQRDNGGMDDMPM